MTTILTVNAGSSSVRLDLVEVLGERVRALAQRHLAGHPEAGHPENGAAILADFIQAHPQSRPDAVAHRVVHGGPRFTAPTLLDDSIVRSLTELASFAPLHATATMLWMRAAVEALPPPITQVCVFDTTFFAALPAIAAAYAIPVELARSRGLRRLGFHGFAHRSMWRQWSERRPDLSQSGLARGGRLVTLQLGSGCSAAAIRAGSPIDTSMGFTPMEGLIMSTRSGDLDPGLVLHLQRLEGLGVDDMERMLERESGLRGLSGTSGDMRSLLADKEDPAACFAVDAFCYRVRKYVGAYLAVLGGLDGIVFGGGVGENSPAVRSASLSGLEAFGIVVDEAKNRAAVGREDRISPPGAAVEIRVVQVFEAGEMARDAANVLGSSTGD
jgi:acetate kinase